MTARQAAEWAHHAACWTAFPSAADLWEDNLAPAQAEVAAMIRVIAESERVELLVNGLAAELAARDLLGSANVGFHQFGFGDIWLRDTGPLFLSSPVGHAAAAVQT